MRGWFEKPAWWDSLDESPKTPPPPAQGTPESRESRISEQLQRTLLNLQARIAELEHSLSLQEETIQSQQRLINILSSIVRSLSDNPQALDDLGDFVPKSQDQDLQLLYLSPEAPREVVDAVYRTLSKIYHPDAGGSEALMRRLNDARDRIYQMRGWK